MKLIFMQGNPGEKFQATRHNVGFLLADAIAQKHDASFKDTSKFSAQIAEFSVGAEKVIIAKPDTFYNETGRSFTALKQFYKFENSDVLIVHDELALQFGTIRSRVGGSDAGNNGVKSINAHGGADTYRLRIGISNELRVRMDDTDFVLGKFSKSEIESLTDKIFPKCLEGIEYFIAGNHQVTSHTLIDENIEIV